MLTSINREQCQRTSEQRYQGNHSLTSPRLHAMQQPSILGASPPQNKLLSVLKKVMHKVIPLIGTQYTGNDLKEKFGDDYPIAVCYLDILNKACDNISKSTDITLTVNELNTLKKNYKKAEKTAMYFTDRYHLNNNPTNIDTEIQSDVDNRISRHSRCANIALNASIPTLLSITMFSTLIPNPMILVPIFYGSIMGTIGIGLKSENLRNTYMRSIKNKLLNSYETNLFDINQKITLFDKIQNSMLDIMPLCKTEGFGLPESLFQENDVKNEVINLQEDDFKPLQNPHISLCQKYFNNKAIFCFKYHDPTDRLLFEREQKPQYHFTVLSIQGQHSEKHASSSVKTYLGLQKPFEQYIRERT